MRKLADACKDVAGRAAGNYRPAACAPQKSGFDPREQRCWFADNMDVRQSAPLRVRE